MRCSASRSFALARSARTRRRIPFDERPPSEHAVVPRPESMSPDSKEILRHSVYRREPLHVGGRREAPHPALPLTRRVVGDLGSIVRVLISDVGPPTGRCCMKTLRGVVARIVTGPHDANQQDPHLPMRYDTGRPRAVIRFRISQPRTASLPCPAGLRARRSSPMMDL